MITVNEAVENAIKFATTIASMKTEYIPRESNKKQPVIFPLEKVRVEEVNYSESENAWLITLGWNDKEFKKKISSSTLTGAIAESPRIYKVIYINSESGQVNKMVMRNI